MKKLFLSLATCGCLVETVYINAMDPQEQECILLSLFNEKLGDFDYQQHNPQGSIVSLCRNELKQLDVVNEFNSSRISALILTYNDLVDLHGLPNSLPNLRRLDISYNRLQHLTGLPNDTHLQSLVLSKNDLAATHLAYLLRDINIDCLERLSADYCNLGNLFKFPQLPNLRYLTLEGNRLRNLDDLSQLIFPCLEELFLQGNPLTIDSVRNFPWENMPKLRVLKLPDNSFDGIYKQQIGATHPNIEIHWVK